MCLILYCDRQATLQTCRPRRCYDFFLEGIWPFPNNSQSSQFMLLIANTLELKAQLRNLPAAPSLALIFSIPGLAFCLFICCFVLFCFEWRWLYYSFSSVLDIRFLLWRCTQHHEGYLLEVSSTQLWFQALCKLRQDIAVLVTDSLWLKL